MSAGLAADGFELVTAPGPGEESHCADLVPEARCLADLDLAGLVALASSVDLVLANDSGVMHVAAAVATPVVGIYGTTDPERSLPRRAIALGSLGEWPRTDHVRRFVRELV